MKKRVILPAILLTGALAAGSLGFSRVSAQEADTYPPIVQKIAERFGLNESDVEDVFDEVHAEHHAEMLANFEDRLSQAVTDGKITEDQKQAILDKHEEFQAKMDEIKDMPEDERRAAMEQIHEDMKTWADENGIDIPLFAMGRGPGPEDGGGHHMMMW